MPQFYTLEEAARVLGMSNDELKLKAQHREIRAFMDSGSWRFRVADVDELARRRGMGSDPDLSLSDLELAPPSDSGSDAELNLSEYQLGVANPDLGAPSTHMPTGTEADVRVDDLTLPPPPMTGSSSTIIGMAPSGKQPSDSDVRLVPDNVKDASDSDVQLGQTIEHRPSDSDVTLVSDDEGPVPGSSDTFPVAGPGDTAVRKGGAMLGSSAEVTAAPADDSDSDFELTPSSVIDALQPESGSDFELTALDHSDEFESTPMPGPSDSDVTAAEPAASGINLARPSDSGINLQGVGGIGLGGNESIELAPLEGEEKPQARSKPAAKPAKPAKPSPGATPLPKAKQAKEKDIFEDTDFEVDALESGPHDQTVQIDAASDYDLEEDSGSDSGSEVFAVDEEDVDQSAATALAPGISDEDEGEEEDFAGDEGEMPSEWDVESEAGPGAAAATPAPAMLGPTGASAEWGGIWVGMLSVATLFVLLLAFVSMDLVRNLYDYRGPVPVASGLVKGLSDMFGGK
jgi:excisionase family DNA binding protein